MELSFKNIPAKKFFLLYIFLVAVLFFLLGKYCLTIPVSNSGIREWLFLSQRHDVNRQTQTYADTDSTLQKTRKEDIYENCRRTRVFKPSANSSVTMIHNSKFNLSFVDIPKIGSTFIKQMFSVLKYGPTYAKEKVKIPRNKVHSDFKGESKLFLFNNTLEETLTIVTVWNPYSRLFAAFVDKVFLPNSLQLVSGIISYKHKHISENVANHTRTDSNITSELSVTFQDFLNYALDHEEKKKTMFGHYDPCFPRLKRLVCYSNHYIVVKQETFETDIKYILRSVGVDKAEHETYNVIIKSLYESRVEDSIPGIIKVTFAHAKGHTNLWTGPIVAARLWESFQIQGYISKHVPFPKKYLNSKSTYSNVSLISNVFLREMQSGKLSRIESMEQRKEFLLHAYNGLSQTVFRKIQLMYEADFKAFGYKETLT